jgi:hypothetical protein
MMNRQYAGFFQPQRSSPETVPAIGMHFHSLDELKALRSSLPDFTEATAFLLRSPLARFRLNII